jgi:hypothetical protein
MKFQRYNKRDLGTLLYLHVGSDSLLYGLHSVVRNSDVTISLLLVPHSI